MAIVDIHGLPKPLAVGLDWHSLPGATSERKEIDKLSQREGIKFGCVVSDDDAGTTVVGLFADQKLGVACGAAWLAAASKRDAIILLEPIDDDRFWLCAVRAGLPVPGRDTIITLADLNERLGEFMAACPDSRVCSPVENLDQIYPNVHPQSFAEIVVNTKPERVRRIAGVNPVTVGLVVVSLVVLGGWYGADSYMSKLRQVEAKAKLEQLSESQKRADAEHLEQLRRQHREAGEALVRKVVLDQPSVDVMLDATMSQLESMPLVVAGWQLVGFDCTRQSCSLQWHREGLGTVLGFIRSAEQSGWVVSDVSGSDAHTSHLINASPRTASIDALDPDLPFRAALETKLQEASSSGMSYDLGPSEPLDKQLPRASAGAKPGALPQEPLPWKVGTLTIKGTQLFELRSLPHYITHPGIAVKDLRGDLKLNEWTLELDYATR